MAQKWFKIHATQTLSDDKLWAMDDLTFRVWFIVMNLFSLAKTPGKLTFEKEEDLVNGIVEILSKKDSNKYRLVEKVDRSVEKLYQTVFKKYQVVDQMVVIECPNWLRYQQKFAERSLTPIDTLRLLKFQELKRKFKIKDI